MDEKSKQFLRYCIVDGSVFWTDDENEYLCTNCRQLLNRGTDTARKETHIDEVSQQITAWMPDFELLGRFKVIRLIGETGLDRVYQVEDLHTRKMLAVKCPRLEWDSTAGLEQARREAEILFNLHGAPRVLQIDQARLWEGVPLIFTELADGGDLSQAIRDRMLYSGGKQAALRRVLDVAIQTAWGLDWIHQARIVHGGLKSANILLMADGQVRIAGFGLAQVLPKGQESILCRGNTPAYASPEQSKGDEITIKSDLWNWSVSLLEMFIGEITWIHGIAAMEALEAYLEEGVEAPDLPVMPAMLAALLRRCFLPDPAERPESMGWIAGKLENIYQHVCGERHRFSWVDLILEPEKLDYLLHQGVWYFELGEFERAAGQFERAIQNFPQCAWARFNLGMTRLNLNPVDTPAALLYFEPLPSYQDPGFSIGQVSEHFMSLHNVKIDPVRQVVWIDGDIGIALVGGPRYAPYSFAGLNLGPDQLLEFGDRQNWFRYGDTGRSPWQLAVQDPVQLKTSISSKTPTILIKPGFIDSALPIRCAICGADISNMANSDGRAAELGNHVIYWCSQCSWKQFAFQSYPIDDLGYIEYKHLGGRWAFTALGHHATTGRVASIKHIRYWRNQEEGIAKYLADINKLAGIAHPHCTRIIETSFTSRSVEVASAYVPGSNLLELVEGRQGRRITPREAAAAVQGLLDGLEQMHQLGFTHANLHPGNILFQNSDLSRPKLCLADFSPAYSMDSYDPEQDLPTGGEFYMLFLVRELVVGSSRREPTWDLYSLGQALYYLLTGITSFGDVVGSENVVSASLIEMIVHPEPIPIQERLPSISSSLADVVDRAVGQPTQDRYQTVDEFRRELNEALVDL
jgi:serine/threonine protein kinase